MDREKLPPNHEEAFLLAHAKKDSSNLARCYIEKHGDAAEMLEALKHVAGYFTKSGGMIGDLPLVCDAIAKAEGRK